jgi:hypothetical protein
MTALEGVVPLLKPKPHTLTIGATVMSKAPSVSLEIRSASVKTSINISLSFTASLRFTREMTDCLLNVDKASSTFCISASMPFCRFSSLW